ncbi:MAG TPA: site-specific integrase, partial [Lacipirellulaceae bacterium]|nr:site-specific integrase [Lacipirellulaceae bacterium]
AVLAFTGMRSGNARHLLVEDVDLNEGWIHVRSRPGAETKGGNHWKVPVHARLSRILQALPRRTSGYFFTAAPSPRYPEGGHWINTKHLNEDFQKVLKRLKLPAGRQDGFTIHDLRHTAASLLIAAGADVKAVQVILGHSTATMTMDLYGHLFSEATWQAMERLPVIPLMQAPRAIDPAKSPGHGSVATSDRDPAGRS